MKLFVLTLALQTTLALSIECGVTGSIWTKPMGNSGACNPCNPPAMTSNDTALWTCSTTGDIALDMSGLEDARKCMSFSSKGSCEFKQKDLLELQVTLESHGCNGLWVAPLWIAPDHWSAPQHATGEVDIFERGCSVEDGYLLSLGEEGSYILNNAWQQKGQPNTESSFTAYLVFNRSHDTLTTYHCPQNSNPIIDGTASCKLTRTATGYFGDTAGQTQNGEEYMHFVSDVWNQCDTQCSKSLPKSMCKFQVSNLKMRLAGDLRSGGADACKSLLVSGAADVHV